MSYPIAYLIQKFDDAIRDLALGPGDARSRIGDAYRRFWIIPINDYPAHLRADRVQIDKLLTELGGDKGYIIPQNIERMSNAKAVEIATMIYDLRFELTRKL